MSFVCTRRYLASGPRTRSPAVVASGGGWLDQHAEGAGSQAHPVQERGLGNQDHVVDGFAHPAHCFGSGFPHGQAVGDGVCGFGPDDAASAPAVRHGRGGGGADADDTGGG